MDIEFCQKIFQHLLRLSCACFSSIYQCSVSHGLICGYWKKFLHPLDKSHLIMVYDLFIGNHFCCYCSVTQLCLNLWDLMDYRTPGFPVPHYLSEIVQIHVYWVDDAIQQTHSLSSPSPPVLGYSQHQGLLNWVRSSYQVAEVLEIQLQY